MCFQGDQYGKGGLDEIFDASTPYAKVRETRPAFTSFAIGLRDAT